MARLSAATALLLLSLLAVAHCRVLDLEVEPATDDASHAVFVTDEQGPPNPTVPKEASATEVVPAHRFAAGEGFLRQPSHRRHHQPCRHGHALLHRIPWWARHHGIFLEDTYRFHRHGSGFPHLVDSRAHLAVDMPAELPHVDEPKYAEEEVKAFAEPDTDRSHPDTDRDQEIEEETKKPFHGVEEEDDETVRAWKREMWRRFRHGLRFHHRRHHHEDEEESDHKQDEEGAGAMKRFHHDQDDEEEEKTRKRFHHHDDDSDNEDDEAEEMARRWRKAIMRRRFHHGARPRCPTPPPPLRCLLPPTPSSSAAAPLVSPGASSLRRSRRLRRPWARPRALPLCRLGSLAQVPMVPPPASDVALPPASGSAAAATAGAFGSRSVASSSSRVRLARACRSSAAPTLGRLRPRRLRLHSGTSPHGAAPLLAWPGPASAARPGSPPCCCPPRRGRRPAPPWLSLRRLLLLAPSLPPTRSAPAWLARPTAARLTRPARLGFTPLNSPF